MSRKVLMAFCIALALPLGMFAESRGQITLKVWDQWRAENDSKAITMVDDNFMKKYPNVKIERTAMPESEIADLIKAALSSDSGPDVIYSEVGIGFIGPMLKAGAILDLTNTWKARGWNDKLFPVSKSIPSVGGRNYAVGCELEFCPIYYNKTLFKKLGINEPKTMSDLDAAMAKLKAAGVTPWAWGGKTWWNNANLVGSVLWDYLDQDTINKQMYQDVSWKSNPAVKDALNKCLVEWAQKGYYPTGGEALTDDEGLMLFYQGKAAMVPNSNANIEAFLGNIGDKFEVSSFNWPKVTPKSKPNTVAFIGSGYMVNAKTKYQQAAIDYIDFVCANPDSAKIFYEVASKFMPYKKAIPNLKVPRLVAEARAALTDSSLLLLPGINMTAPPEVMTFLETNAVQVMTKQIDVPGWIDQFDSLWQKSKAEGMTLSTFKW